MYSTLEKYTFDNRKKIGGEPIIERFGLTRKKSTRSNSRKDSRKNKSQSKSRTKSGVKSMVKSGVKSMVKSGVKSMVKSRSKSRSKPTRKSRSPNRKSVKETTVNRSNSRPSQAEDDTSGPDMSNIQKVNVNIDRDDGYSQGCGNDYWNDGYLGPGGFIYRYPPPWNYMDSINPGFYYPEIGPPFQTDYCGETVDVPQELPINNNINVFSGDKNVQFPDDMIRKIVSHYPAQVDVRKEERDESDNKESSTRVGPTLEKKDINELDKADSGQSKKEESSDFNITKVVSKDVEEFPSEPVKCGDNRSAIITTIIILGIIVLISIVLAFVFIRKQRRE